MPIFNVRAPDGSLMKISGPEDATDEELIQIAEQNYCLLYTSPSPIAKGLYDPKQEILVGSGEEGAYGAGVGALTSLIVDLTLGRHAHVDMGGKPKELGQTPVAIQPAPVATLPEGKGFDAERAAGCVRTLFVQSKIV